ncbi:MAG TPA: hypothetical protein PKN04_12725 [bacterium]|nr:hypothetical protein [bacterium]
MTKIARLAFVFVVWVGIQMNSLPAAEPQAISVGDRRELFIDLALTDTLIGRADLRLHHPVRQEIALLHDAPWEGNACGYHTVFQDDSLYRMTYKAWNIARGGDVSNPVVICYAESRDGIHWIKSDLGLVEFAGSTHNNILFDQVQGHGCHDFSPFIDRNPAALPEQRYKAVGFVRGLEEDSTGLYGFVSADAIHWHLVQDDFIIRENGWVFDTQNTAFWSQVEQQYVLYYRKTVNEIRNIARAVSKDFVHWEKQGLVDFGMRGPNAREQFYTNQIRPYDRAPHLLIGFPARYCDRGWIRATDALPSLELRRDRAKGQVRYGSAVTDALLISSRDGRRFFRWNEAFLRPGLRTRHNWAYGDNYIAWHAVETESAFDDQPRELSLYATESYFTGDWSRLRRYTLRLDGFASLYAPAEGGEWISKPLLFGGNRLELNFATSAAGEIRVELLKADGQAIPGFELEACEPIFGDNLAYTVCWNESSDLSSLQGKPVRLHLILREADVFAFRFGE